MDHGSIQSLESGVAHWAARANARRVSAQKRLPTSAYISWSAFHHHVTYTRLKKKYTYTLAIKSTLLIQELEKLTIVTATEEVHVRYLKVAPIVT